MNFFERNLLPTAGSVILAMVLAVAVAIVYLNSSSNIDRVATETHDALCAFKTDLATRYVNTQLFISQIRKGERPPIPGISIADLKRSADNQQATLMSLDPLECEGDQQ